MILVDANLLLYAEDSLSEHHEAARLWWDAQLSGSDPVEHNGVLHSTDADFSRFRGLKWKNPIQASFSSRPPRP